MIETDHVHESGKGNAIFSENGRIDSYKHIEFIGPRQFFDFIVVQEDDSALNTQRSNDDQMTCNSDDADGTGNGEDAKARASKRFKRTKPRPVRSKGITKGERLKKSDWKQPENNFYEKVMEDMEEAGQS